MPHISMMVELLTIFMYLLQLKFDFPTETHRVGYVTKELLDRYESGINIFKLTSISAQRNYPEWYTANNSQIWM